MIYVVTGNNTKYIEISKVLSSYSIATEQAALDIEEKGQTLEERVLSKANDAWSKLRKPLIVDDTGVFFEALGNFPGAMAKQVFLEIGLEGLLKKLEGSGRKAYFRTLICYVDESGPKIFEGKVSGKITEKIHTPSLRRNVPYEQIFIPDGHEKVFSLFTDEEKSEISHRAMAARKFAEFILKK